MHVRVLFVEDAETDAELALRRLRSDGIDCSFTRVQTEDAFVRALHERDYDVILSDFSLPNFDGMSALEIAVREAPDIPFIFVSATIGEERAIEALRRGAIDYVLKSNLNRLAPAVRRAIRESAQRLARDTAEERLRDVIDIARDWIWELDAAGRFVFSSESVRDLLGVDAQRIVGTHFTQWLHETDRARVVDAMTALDARSRTIAALSARWRHMDGSVRWLERHARVLIDGCGVVTGYRGADRDVTEREAQQARISRLTRVLEMHSGINTAVVRIRDRLELLEEACRIAVSAGHYETVLASFLEPGTGTARPVAWAGDDARLHGLAFMVGTCAAEDSSITGRVLRTGEVFFCNDVTLLDPTMAAWPTLRDIQFRSIVALPLTVDGTTVGALTLTAAESDTITTDELRLLGEVAGNLSFALQYFAKESAIAFLSSFDPLTGLAKRVLFCERLARRLATQRSEELHPAVAIFDIQYLSIINDSYGRHAGDQLLQDIADRLKGRFADTDQVAYLGAGCFAMVLDRAGEQRGALRDLQRHTVALFDKPFRIGGHDVPVTVRSGVACRGKDCADAQTLVQNAEAGLRQAKEAGEQYQHHRLDLSSKLNARLALEHRLRGALDNQQYVLHYQPKFAIGSGRIEGVEALLRWNDPDHGMIGPAQFLPILESTGLIVAVGEWVLQQAASECRRWRSLGLGPLHVAVNCSPLQLRKRGFAEHVLRALEGWAHDGWGLDVEITESLLIDPGSPEMGKLRMLRSAGVRVAIDDFGTGYSSLSRLSDLPVDTLKIDRSFIKGLPHDRAAARLVPTIIGLAQAFDLVTVAEGVETPAQLEFLGRAGCNQSQGFLHAKPMPASELEQLIGRMEDDSGVREQRLAQSADALLSGRQ